MTGTMITERLLKQLAIRAKQLVFDMRWRVKRNPDVADFLAALKAELLELQGDGYLWDADHLWRHRRYGSLWSLAI